MKTQLYINTPRAFIDEIFQLFANICTTCYSDCSAICRGYASEIQLRNVGASMASDMCLFETVINNEKENASLSDTSKRNVPFYSCPLKPLTDLNNIILSEGFCLHLTTVTCLIFYYRTVTCVSYHEKKIYLYIYYN